MLDRWTDLSEPESNQLSLFPIPKKVGQFPSDPSSVTFMLVLAHDGTLVEYDLREPDSGLLEDVLADLGHLKNYLRTYQKYYLPLEEEN